MTGNSQVSRIRKNIPILGIAGPLVVAFSTIAALMVSLSWFSWLGSHMSDLGHPFMMGGSQGTAGFNLASVFFNSGLVLGGIIMFVFALLLILIEREKSSLIGMAGCSLLALGAVFMMLVGILNEAAGPVHFIVSVIFFAFLLLGGLIYGFRLIQKPSNRIDARLAGCIGIISAITGGVLWSLSFGFPHITPWTAFAIPETISVVMSFAWIILLSISMLRQLNQK